MSPDEQVVEPDGFTAVRVCGECSEEIEEGDTEPLYECPECGDTFPMSEGDGGGFSNNRSPCCGKYSSRAGDAHANCGGNSEEASDGFKCEECEEIVESADECATHRREDHPTEEEEAAEEAARTPEERAAYAAATAEEKARLDATVPSIRSPVGKGIWTATPRILVACPTCDSMVAQLVPSGPHGMPVCPPCANYHRRMGRWPRRKTKSG